MRGRFRAFRVVALAAEVRQYYRERIKLPCTTCGYCVPCPSGVLIPDVVSMVNTVAMCDSLRATSGAYEGIMVARGIGADSCSEWGECELKCPQSIPIRDALHAAPNLLSTRAASCGGGRILPDGRRLRSNSGACTLVRATV